MKANELMINDLVKCGKRLVRISNILSHSASGIELVALEPITLTPEILEANGFLSNGEFPNKDHIKVCHGICGNESWYVTFCECYGFDIKYVHELQHILRLVGLTKLADNFKIK